MTGDRNADEAKAEHASVVKTIPTKTGQLTLIVNDDSHWKANALAVICEAALQQAISTLAGMQYLDIDPRVGAIVGDGNHG